MATHQSTLISAVTFVGYGAVIAAVALVVGVARAGQPLDAVVAVVEGTPVLASELVALRTSLQRQGDAVTAPQDLLERKIEDLLIARRAESLGLAVGAKDVDDAIQRIADDNRMTKEQLFRALAEQGLTPADYRELLGQQILRMRIVQREVEPMVRVDRADLVAHMKAHPERFAEPPRISLRFLTVAAAKAGLWLAACADGCMQPPQDLGTELSKQAVVDVDWQMLDEAIRLWLGNQAAPGDVRAFARGTDVVIVRFEASLPGQLLPLDSVYDEVYDEVRRQKMERAFQQWLSDLKADAWIERYTPPSST